MFVLTVIAVPLASLTVVNVGSDLLNLIFAGLVDCYLRLWPGLDLASTP